ncbi:MAG: hypothetical protein LUQ11_11315 [Methylococcaceae bacterium]|nr:hypothetical protein [Methylococcaceae bacterium]
MVKEKWVVGPEYDEQLFRRLGAVLKSMEFCLDSEWDGISGSQDISHWELKSPASSLVIDSETYMSLSVEGTAELVQRVRQQFEVNHAL